MPELAEWILEVKGEYVQRASTKEVQRIEELWGKVDRKLEEGVEQLKIEEEGWS
jgi:hypothetical protein